MVKHIQTIRQQQPTSRFRVFDHFVWLALKGLKQMETRARNGFIPSTGTEPKNLTKSLLKIALTESSYIEETHPRKMSFHCSKMKFSIRDFFSKCDQIRRKQRIWSHLLKESLMENLIFCAVLVT